MHAQQNAYAPYSKFHVGAALVGKNGKIYPGCNVENVVYQGFCAERSALVAAVTDGCREFKELYISTDASTPTPPCGYCRQFLAEFLQEDTPVHIVNRGKLAQTFKFKDLLPHAFGPQNL